MSRPKQSERDALKSDTRRRLITAAVQEIAGLGYEKANINKISLAAGFAKGTIYNYFPSKPALMLALIDEIGSEHVGFITTRVRVETDPARRMERFFTAGFEYIESHPESSSLILATLYGSEVQFKERLERVYRPLFRLVGEDILGAGIAQGLFRPVELMSTASIVLTLYLGAGSRRGPGGKILLDPKQLSALALNGVRK